MTDSDSAVKVDQRVLKKYMADESAAIHAINEASTPSRPFVDEEKPNMNRDRFDSEAQLSKDELLLKKLNRFPLPSERLKDIYMGVLFNG